MCSLSTNCRIDNENKTWTVIKLSSWQLVDNCTYGTMAFPCMKSSLPYLWNGAIDQNISFINLHKMCERATPEMYMNYKLALCLYKLYNVEFNPIEFVLLNNNQIFTGRQVKFFSIKSNTFKVGINSLANRFHTINNSIPLNLLNLLLDTHKIWCEENFIKFRRLKIDKDQPDWLLCSVFVLFSFYITPTMQFACNLFVILLF